MTSAPEKRAEPRAKTAEGREKRKERRHKSEDNGANRCIFTMYGEDVGRFPRKYAVARGLSIDGANRCIFTGYGADVARFPRKCAVAMLGLMAPLREGLLLHFPHS